MKIKYEERKFNKRNLALVEHVNAVVDEYSRQGYNLTLRQIYYQLVARGFIENTKQSYKRIDDLVGNARLAGLIDWNAITDRTRYLRRTRTHESPAQEILRLSWQFHIDQWTNQPNYAEVWVEKDAMIDVIGQACRDSDTPYFSCRGYCSLSGIWLAAQRFTKYYGDREGRYIIYLGDHDPSGIDMARDIPARLKLFGANVEFRRVALTEEQIQTFNPPPNPAKITDSRSAKYIRKFGEDSWELDALEPRFITQLIQGEISKLVDADLVAEISELEREQQAELQLISDNYHDAVAYSRKKNTPDNGGQKGF